MAAKKKTTSEKKHTAVPPTAKAVKPEVAKPVIAETKVEAKPVAVVAPVLENVQPLIAQLHDVDADIARDAASTLGLSKNPAAVEPLIEVIGNTDGYYHSVVRSAAIASLGQLGDKRAFASLLNAVSDTMAEASAEAVRALANLGDTAAVEPLIDVLQNGNGYFLPVVRRAAALALVKLGGEKAIAALRHVANDTNEDAVIRESATIPAK